MLSHARHPHHPPPSTALFFAPLNLTYRAPDCTRTLTDDEVNTAFTKLQDAIAKHQPDWQIRK